MWTALLRRSHAPACSLLAPGHTNAASRRRGSAPNPTRRLRGDPECSTPPPGGAHCRAPSRVGLSVAARLAAPSSLPGSPSHAGRKPRAGNGRNRETGVEVGVWYAAARWFAGHTGAGGGNGHLGPGTVGDEPGCGGGRRRGPCAGAEFWRRVWDQLRVRFSLGVGTRHPLARAKRFEGQGEVGFGLVDRFADRDARSHRPNAPTRLTSPGDERTARKPGAGVIRRFCRRQTPTRARRRGRRGPRRTSR